MELDNKPQPMAGFSVGLVSPYKRTDQVKRKPENQLVRNVTENESEKVGRLDFGGDIDERPWREDAPPPPLTRRLTPMTDLLESLLETERENAKYTLAEEEPPPPLQRRLTPMSNLLESLLETTPQKDQGEGLHYFPVEVDVDKLVDWKEAANSDKEKNNNNPGGKEKAALVTVNNTEIAVFKYGDTVIATSEKCPHAGGPLHLGDIEVLPDKSLCVRCPWHKWAFCVRSKDQEGSGDARDVKVGSCVHPPFRDDKKLKVFPAVSEANRKHIKIGFESIQMATLVNEHF